MLFFVSREIEDLQEHFGRLGARDGVFSIHDVARHTTDAEAARHLVFIDDHRPIFVTAEIGARRIAVQPVFGGDLGQHLDLSDIPAVGEIGPKQCTHDRMLAPVAAGVGDQAVGIDRVGRAFDAVEPEVDALLAASVADEVQLR